MMLDYPLIWGFLIAVAIFAYVVLDGFDLGIGILYPTTKDADERTLMMNSVAPVWMVTRRGSSLVVVACLRCFRWPTPSSCLRCMHPLSAC